MSSKHWHIIWYISWHIKALTYNFISARYNFCRHELWADWFKTKSSWLVFMHYKSRNILLWLIDWSLRIAAKSLLTASFSRRQRRHRCSWKQWIEFWLLLLFGAWQNPKFSSAIAALELWNRLLGSVDWKAGDTLLRLNVSPIENKLNR